MSLQPTHGDESQIRRRPRGSGDPFLVDSRLRGNDVTFERSGILLCAGGPLTENQGEIPRSARNDSQFQGSRELTDSRSREVES